MIKYIVQLADKKPILALVAILLVGLTVLGSVIKIMDNREQLEKDRLRAAIESCEKERRENDIKCQEKIQAIQDKANEELKKQLESVNKILLERVQKLDNITQSSKKVLIQSKMTNKSQQELLKQLNLNEKNVE